MLNNLGNADLADATLVWLVGCGSCFTASCVLNVMMRELTPSSVRISAGLLTINGKSIPLSLLAQLPD